MLTVEDTFAIVALPMMSAIVKFKIVNVVLALGIPASARKIVP